MIRHVCDGERRLTKVVQLVVGFKTYFREDQPEEISQKHVDCELAALVLKLVSVLATLVRITHRQRFRFLGVEIGVGDDRSTVIGGIGCKVLRELYNPSVASRISH